MRKYFTIESILVVLFLVTIVSLIANDSSKTIYCTSQSTVVDIVSIDGRDATILLSNGQTRVVNQRTLKNGDNYCLTYIREKK